jgi:pilus assembly protein CpaF
MIPSGAFAESIPRFLQPIRELLDDPAVSEIMINGPEEIWVERGGILSRTDLRFPGPRALEAALVNISQYAGRPVSAERPILEAHLPDGSRLEAVLSPVAKVGPTVSIRRFSSATLTIPRLVELGSLSRDAARFLAAAVRRKVNAVVSGGTGSGKTSLLGALSTLVPDSERIVVIEDTHEVRLAKPHVVYLESRSEDERGRGRISIRDLLRATLRLRPDRIVVGEVRGAEALDLLQAMTSGHGGSMTTVHANTPADALRRIETMALMADTGLPHLALRAQVASAVRMVIQAERTARGKRIVSHISMVRGIGAGGDFRIDPIFARAPDGSLGRVPSSPTGSAA